MALIQFITTPAEDLADAESVSVFKRRLANGEEELMSAEFANRIIDGESKVKVWRECRAMSAVELAEKAAISAAILLQIEKGEREASFDTIEKIAAALKLSVDDLA
ncbi:helix-turn-helix transcriptional regulator [Rhizobium leguminosarum]